MRLSLLLSSAGVTVCFHQNNWHRNLFCLALLVLYTLGVGWGLVHVEASSANLLFLKQKTVATASSNSSFLYLTEHIRQELFFFYDRSAKALCCTACRKIWCWSSGTNHIKTESAGSWGAYQNMSSLTWDTQVYHWSNCGYWMVCLTSNTISHWILEFWPSYVYIMYSTIDPY